MLGECSSWRVRLVAFYGWGIAVLSLWSSAALYCEATSSLSTAPHGRGVPRPQLSLPQADSGPSLQDGHIPGHCWYPQEHSGMIKLMASKSWNFRGGMDGKIIHEVQDREITRPRSHSSSGHTQQGLEPVLCLPASPSSTVPQCLHCQKVRAEQPRPWTPLAVPLPSGQGACGAKEIVR